MNSRMVRNLKLVPEVPTSRKNWARRSPQSWVAQRQVGSFNWRFHAFKQCKCNPSLPSNSRKIGSEESQFLLRRIFDASFSQKTELFRKVLMLILRQTWSVGRLAMSFQTKQVGSSAWVPSRHCCVVSTTHERGI